MCRPMLTGVASTLHLHHPQRLVALEKQAAAAASSPAGERSRSARRPRTPLVLYQAPRRSEVGDADAQAAA